jgi:hypothetical protein
MTAGLFNFFKQRLRLHVFAWFPHSYEFSFTILSKHRNLRTKEIAYLKSVQKTALVQTNFRRKIFLMKIRVSLQEDSKQGGKS